MGRKKHAPVAIPGSPGEPKKWDEIPRGGLPQSLVEAWHTLAKDAGALCPEGVGYIVVAYDLGLFPLYYASTGHRADCSRMLLELAEAIANDLEFVRLHQRLSHGQKQMDGRTGEPCPITFHVVGTNLDDGTYAGKACRSIAALVDERMDAIHGHATADFLVVSFDFERSQLSFRGHRRHNVTTQRRTHFFSSGCLHRLVAFLRHYAFRMIGDVPRDAVSLIVATAGRIG